MSQEGFPTIGADEIPRQSEHRCLTLAYPQDEGCRRLLAAEPALSRREASLRERANMSEAWIVGLPAGRGAVESDTSGTTPHGRSEVTAALPSGHGSCFSRQNLVPRTGLAEWMPIAHGNVASVSPRL